MGDCFVRLGYLDPDDDPAPMIRIMRIVFEPALVDADYDPRQYQSVDRAMEVAQISFEHRIFKSPGHRVFLVARAGRPRVVRAAARDRHQLAAGVPECVERARAARPVAARSPS